MADFCKQCSLEMFNKDFGDLAHLGKTPPPADMGFSALCEGCGPTIVDWDGVCIAKWCPLHGSDSKNKT